MKQNKYDDPIFFEKYSQMSRSQQGLVGKFQLGVPDVCNFLRFLRAQESYERFQFRSKQHPDFKKIFQ